MLQNGKEMNTSRNVFFLKIAPRIYQLTQSIFKAVMKKSNNTGSGNRQAGGETTMCCTGTTMSRRVKNGGEKNSKTHW